VERAWVERGAARLQSMLMACGGDMDEAMSLSYETDYDEGHIHHYDMFTHRVEPNAFGALYFIRLRAGAERQ
jgi:hypothetical protein